LETPLEPSQASDDHQDQQQTETTETADSYDPTQFERTSTVSPRLLNNNGFSQNSSIGRLTPSIWRELEPWVPENRKKAFLEFLVSLERKGDLDPMVPFINAIAIATEMSLAIPQHIVRQGEITKAEFQAEYERLNGALKRAFADAGAVSTRHVSDLRSVGDVYVIRVQESLNKIVERLDQNGETLFNTLTTLHDNFQNLRDSAKELLTTPQANVEQLQHIIKDLTTTITRNTAISTDREARMETLLTHQEKTINDLKTILKVGFFAALLTVAVIAGGLGIIIGYIVGRL
jgi:methyl-accepting chemotaxis protein